MVSRDGFAKVLDFGLAKLTESEIGGRGRERRADAHQRAHGRGGGDGNRRLHVAGAGAGEARRPPLRHLLVRLHPLRSRDAQARLRGGLRRRHDAQDPPRRAGRVARAEPEGSRRPAPAGAALPREEPRPAPAIDEGPRHRAAGDRGQLRVAVELDELGERRLPPSGPWAPPRPAGRRAWLIGGAIVAILGIAGLAIGIASLMGRRAAKPADAAPAAGLQLTSISGRPGVCGVAISGDGRYLAYPIYSSGSASIWVRQIATGSEVQVVPPRKAGLGRPSLLAERGLSSSTSSASPDAGPVTTLERVPTLGGPSRRLASDVGYGFSLTRDGKSICFVRWKAKSDESSAIVRDLEQGQEKTLATLASPLSFEGPPALVTRRQDVRHGRSHGGEGHPRAIRGDRRGEPGPDPIRPDGMGGRRFPLASGRERTRHLRVPVRRDGGVAALLRVVSRRALPENHERLQHVLEFRSDSGRRDDRRAPRR